MKKLLCLLIACVVYLPDMLHAQTSGNGNPFAHMGYKASVGTFSDRQEFHDQTSVVEIGSVLLDTRTRKVIGFVQDRDSLVELPPEIISTSIDPLCEKYYSISPYVYVMNNPIRFVDHKGDSISLAAMQAYDSMYGTNYTQTTINDLQSQTGLTLTVSSGNLLYAKDWKGNPIINTTTDNNGNTVQVGSATARAQLVSSISNTDWVSVGINAKTNISFVSPGSNQIWLSPNQINGFINGTNNMDNRTLGWGMTFMHELHHTQVGGGLRDTPGNPGPVVTQMNTIRSELNSLGGDYGSRINYYSTPINRRKYIPFNNASAGGLLDGLIPIPRSKFISY